MHWVSLLKHQDFTQPQEEVEYMLECSCKLPSAHLEHTGDAVVWTPGLVNADPVKAWPYLNGYRNLGILRLLVHQSLICVKVSLGEPVSQICLQ